MSRNCTSDEPHLTELLADLGPTGLGLVISTGVATLFVLVISILTVVRVHRNTADSHERFLFYCLVGICPVVGVTSYIGIISPRSILIDDMVAAVYLSLNVVVFFRLMMYYHGGEKALCENMNGIKVPFTKPPCCCCLCFRNIYVNRRTLKRLKTAVYQVVVARPLLLFMGAVIKTEEETASPSFADNPIKLVVSILTTISTITAIFALMSTFRLSANPLKSHQIVPKFVHLRLVLLFCDPQAMIVNLVVAAVGLPCGDLFFHPSRGDTVKFVLLCFEMALLSVLGFTQYGKPRLEPLPADKTGLENGIATVVTDVPTKPVANGNGEIIDSTKL